MTQALRIPDPPIATSEFILRPWQPEDAEAVAAACADPITQQFITEMPRPYTWDHATSFIARSHSSLREGRAIGMAIADPARGRAIGSITLHATRPEHWYIGYWMAPDWRNRGITSTAVKLFSSWAFAEYPELVRLSLYTLPANAASQRVAERAGFTREGVLRSWENAAGVPEDVVMFSLVRGDVASTHNHGGKS